MTQNGQQPCTGIQVKTIKFLEENRTKSLHPWNRQNLLMGHKETLTIKEKIVKNTKLDFIKLKKLCSSEETIKKMKR